MLARAIQKYTGYRGQAEVRRHLWVIELVNSQQTLLMNRTDTSI